MMRYQTVSTECIPLSIGKKPLLKACKEDDLVSNNGGGRAFDPKPLRASQDHQHQHEPLLPEPERSPVSVPKTQNESNGDVLLQWGRRKRTRLSRAESRPAPEDDHESESSRPPIKVRRRSAAGSNRLGAAAAMPPPPPPPSFGRLRPSPPSLLPHRITDHASSSSRPEKRPSALQQEKSSKMAIGDISLNSETSCPPKSNRETVDIAGASTTTTNEWPRILIALSRKEKEDDFLVMKGTKLPQRPKKRPKNIEKTLQYCFPGLWLSELTRGRYEVRERKCVKKKKRGLKGMESMDSDSE
ncbi:uncharacterized protein LOC120262453 isoform X1 [Dioscorea cayenensis subsp. rotundata]|uniref:Uncharacterized protein LOC120262453 isoform X1 n=1 Tax=Dioscorea cayennensis subsp. rotundata TaxID=55577 RepID=A0AB40BHT7_DIOCR|nr:uncharacterized protein LOC120262453 isoform X1 [Dioscorea cayenensis subsp. rotundata]